MSTAKFDTLSTLDGSQSVPVNTVAQGSAKAWVNFNGTGTVAIRAAFNVSSITDNGTGDYTLNFTTAMPDVNYSTVLSSLPSSSNNGLGRQIPFIHSTSQYGTTSLRVVSNWAGDGNTREDNQLFCVAIFR